MIILRQNQFSFSSGPQTNIAHENTNGSTLKKTEEKTKAYVGKIKNNNEFFVPKKPKALVRTAPLFGNPLRNFTPSTPSSAI